MIAHMYYFGFWVDNIEPKGGVALLMLSVLAIIIATITYFNFTVPYILVPNIYIEINTTNF